MPWDYYGIMLSLTVAGTGYSADNSWWAMLGIAAWFLLTTRFITRRLARNSLTVSHVSEMILTSLFIPWLSVFWRLYGAVRFRVVFL
jgi:hypothetical protein